MQIINLRDAKARFFRLVDEVALVSRKAVGSGRKALARKRGDAVTPLKPFSGGKFERKGSPSRDIDF